jgi:hypothetical protein
MPKNCVAIRRPARGQRGVSRGCGKRRHQRLAVEFGASDVIGIVGAVKTAARQCKRARRHATWSNAISRGT